MTRNQLELLAELVVDMLEARGATLAPGKPSRGSQETQCEKQPEESMESQSIEGGGDFSSLQTAVASITALSREKPQKQRAKWQCERSSKSATRKGS